MNEVTPNVSVRKMNVISIAGSYFTDRVLIPYPTEYVSATDKEIKMTCLRIFKQVREQWRERKPIDDWFNSGFTDKENKTKSLPVKTDTLMCHTIREIFADELLSLLDDNITNNHADRIVNQTLDDVFPNKNEYDNHSNEIYTEGVVIHLTRVLLQTVFDKLRTEGPTHMSVDSPLGITEHKWDEVKINKHVSTDDVKFKYGVRNALQLDGVFFDESVVIPAPDEEYASHSAATQVANDVFEAIIDTYDVNAGLAFDPVDTEAFARQLRITIKEKNKSPSRTKTPRLNAELNDLLPQPRTYDNVPNKIRNSTVLIHITRMVLQTLFGQLHNHQTHMDIEDPFNVTTHKWDATKPGSCSDD